MQAIPLPGSWVTALSPPRAEALLTHELAGVVQPWLTLSLDLGRTLESVVVGSAIVSAYWVGRIVAARETRRSIIVAVAASATLLALVAFGHELFSAKSVYGWHDPVFTSPRLLSPLVNGNHLGAVLALGSTLCLGMAIAMPRGGARWACAIATALCGVGALATGSRGAVLSLLLGFGFVATAAVRRKSVTARVLVPVGVSIAVFLVATYLSLDEWTKEFQSDYSKLGIAVRAFSLALAFPLTGIGRGAFAPVYARVDEGREWVMTPENLPVVWATEWGIIVAAILMTAVCATIFRATRSRHLEVASASLALLALGAHDLVDFCLEMPGVAPVAAMLLGGIATRESRVRRAPRRAILWVGFASVGVAIGLGSFVPQLRSETLIRTLSTSDGDPEAVGRLVARYHPFDPELALWVGHAHSQHGDVKAFGWLTRAMQLAPHWASAHVIASEALMRMGATRQALLEVREAEVRQRNSAIEVACALVSRAPPEMIIELSPDPDYVNRLARCADTSEIDAVAISRGVANAGLHIRLARRALRANDLDAASAHVSEVRSQDPTTEAGLLLEVEIRWRREGAGPALSLLEDKDSSPALRLRARISASSGDRVAVEQSLAELRSRVAGDHRELSRVWQFAGSVYEECGDLGQALQAYVRSEQLFSRNFKSLEGQARLAAELGQQRRSTVAWSKLCDFGVQRACRRLESETTPRQRNPLRLQ